MAMGSLNNDNDGSRAFGCPPRMEKFLCDRLGDPAQPISERFRALFSLRNLKGPTPRDALILGSFNLSKSAFFWAKLFFFSCILLITSILEQLLLISRVKLRCFLLRRSNFVVSVSRCEATRDSSNLLAHEAAFALGQMQDEEAIPALISVLNDLSLHPIVRHEAAEALGAIGLETNVPFLKNSLVLDPAQEVRETCELALNRIDQMKSAGGNDEEISPFMSVDPAAPASSCSSVDQLRIVLLNEEKGMYERYAALFALRNHGGDEAVSAIIDSLGSHSSLLKHEVAYVLGQLQDKAASAALSKILRDVNEHPMVRHEAAEALGSIADLQSIALLEEFVKDIEPIVSQSCEVALSMLEFERSGKSFEYLFMENPLVQ